jgi:hypothetical protein
MLRIPSLHVQSPPVGSNCRDNHPVTGDKIFDLAADFDDLAYGLVTEYQVISFADGSFENRMDIRRAGSNGQRFDDRVKGPGLGFFFFYPTHFPYSKHCKTFHIFHLLQEYATEVDTKSKIVCEHIHYNTDGFVSQVIIQIPHNLRI